ncbi:hypothetical protein ACNOYE_02500 [Nannocystaceae bacterium ST9]
MSARDHWQAFWHAPISPLPLAGFRQAFLWTMLIYFVAWARFAPEWLTAAGYHPDASIDPGNAPGSPLLPEAALPWVGAVFFGALLADLFGFARRWTIWILLLGAIHALLVDPIAAFTINRLFVIGLVILAVAPEPTSEGQRAWPVRMLQVTVVAQYFASGLCKTIHGDWWAGEDVLWTQIQGVYMNDFAAWLVRTLPEWAWVVLEEITLWFELLAPLLFAVRRLRPLALVLGIGLHVVVAATMDQLIYFSLQMISFYVLFMPTEWLERLDGLVGSRRAVA